MSVTQASLLGDTFGSKASGTIPVGGIIMWSGSIGTIPTGWALCNGSNGTPNLQDRFIVGAGSGYAVAATGGSANATLVSHSHTATSTVNEGLGHSHNYNDQTVYTFGDGQRGGGTNYVARDETKTTTKTLTGITVATSITPAGSSATNANLPPYYALAFIMRTS